METDCLSEGTTFPSAPADVLLNIRFGYPWRDGIPEDDLKYQFLRNLGAGAGEAVERVRGPNGQRLRVRTARLRGLHGAAILDDIRRRIFDSDVLLFDLGGTNSNVLIELGMALACSENNRAVFVLLPEGAPVPSDLSGYLVTYYRETDEYRVVDHRGFHAALRAALFNRARSKEGWLSWRPNSESKTNASDQAV
jgi:hypothetical protein